MATEAEARPLNIGLYLNPQLERRAAFQLACRDMFHSLQLDASAAAAAPMLGRQRVDLLVLDLHGFQRSRDLIPLGELVRNRGGAPTLVLCPFAEAAWIPELMAFGSVQYMITPSATSELQQTVRQALRQLDHSPGADLIEFQLLAKEKELRELLVIQRSLQRALADTDDADKVAAQVCLSLCAFPGVRHAALLHLKEGGDLALAAQESRNHLDLARLLGSDHRLFDSPLHAVFPGVLAAAHGDMVLLDSPEKAGDPELAVSLHDKDVQMVLAVPLTRDAAGAVQGALCLMFDRKLQFSREQFACFSSLAQLVSFGLAMSELKRRNDALLTQLTQNSATDALTGAASRRQGEHYLTREIGRARRYELPLALITFDVDQGGGEGGAGQAERALKSLVAATQAKLRGADALVRMSADGFLIIAPHTAAPDALKIAEKIRELVARNGGAGDGMSISLGVAQLGAEESGEAVLQRLGAALHRAKQGGPNRVELAML